MNFDKRLIYAAIFKNKFVYVGLTWNFSKRKIAHMNSEFSTIYKYSKKTKSLPKFIKLTNYINSNLAKKKEIEYVEYYRKNNWKILNKVKAGSLGGGFRFLDKREMQRKCTKI